jgi:hypothetical protein
MEEMRPHVELPREVLAVIGDPDEGTRIYRAEGDDVTYQFWWDTLMEHFPRGLVSPGGACPYAGVSRAAVHKAMKDGRLTVFAFHLYEEKAGILGRKLVRKDPYQYLPVVELKAWRLELEQRMAHLLEAGEASTKLRLRNLVNRELEGEQPDWNAWFMLRHPKGRRVRKGGSGEKA